MKKQATIIGPYRYWLERSWGECGDFVNFVMLNPSTADAEKDDATIRKCIGFAKRWGYIGFHVVNLFALRSTDPDALLRNPDPHGPENAQYLEAALLSAPLTIVAWGSHPAAQSATATFTDIVDRTFTTKPRIEALRINQNGSPGHPLYIPYDTRPVPFTLFSNLLNPPPKGST